MSVQAGSSTPLGQTAACVVTVQDRMIHNTLCKQIQLRECSLSPEWIRTTYLANRIHTESEFMPEYLNIVFQCHFSVLDLYSPIILRTEIFSQCLVLGLVGEEGAGVCLRTSFFPHFFIPFPPAFARIFFLFCNPNNHLRSPEQVRIFLLSKNGREARKLLYLINSIMYYCHWQFVVLLIGNVHCYSDTYPHFFQFFSMSREGNFSLFPTFLCCHKFNFILSLIVVENYTTLYLGNHITVL